MGHDASAGGAMRDGYDAPRVEDLLDEQFAHLPNGPLGVVRPPKVQVESKFPPEALELLGAFLNGNLGELKLAQTLSDLKASTKRESPHAEV